MRREDSELWKAGFTKAWWQSLDRSQRLAVLEAWSDREVEAFLKDWLIWGRDSQLPPPGDWRMWVLLCGRGFGKTRTAVEVVRNKVESGEKGRICLLGQGVDDVRDVMVEGKSGFLATAPSWFRPKWSPSRGGGMLEWPNGALGYVYSAEDPDALRGPEFDMAWIDEIMAFKAAARAAAEANLRFGLRLGLNPQRIYTTTPKPHKWIRDLVNKLMLSDGTPRPEAIAKGLYITRGSTYDNAENLPASFLEGVTDDYEGTRLGRQELYGDVLGDTEGALFTASNIDKHRIMKTASEDEIVSFSRQMERIIVAVDPNMTSTGTSHAAGITVHGRIGEKRYVLHDYSVRGASPLQWGRQVVLATERYAADEIIAEVNQGGDLVRTVIAQVASDMDVPIPRVINVHAHRGKQRRAEPVAAAYEQGKVIHVGGADRFEKMETQLCELHEGLDPTGEDFDRADSVVWGQTRLARAAQSKSGPGPGILAMSEFG